MCSLRTLQSLLAHLHACTKAKQLLLEHSLPTDAATTCVLWRPLTEASASPVAGDLLSLPLGAQAAGPRLSTPQLLDHYHSHTEKCETCLTALARVKLLRVVAAVAAAVSGLAAIACAGVWWAATQLPAFQTVIPPAGASACSGALCRLGWEGEWGLTPRPRGILTAGGLRAGVHSGCALC